ncbi:uncharacterized protein N7483_002286 [Penicillium malachiteum]|uniref:uncharacterized protein n=1 Tax=Penicillium malachiteum TaxID=1324776 RepID=UPI002549B99F|nr:uncharacterized protein N7483_002286 [Penicillium malachiteum]KAJ5737161.1 hypothetical protein N7483_002286 [Penicillium malachiteum]
MTNALVEALDHAGGHGKADQGESLSSFLASLATALIVFGVEFLLFMILKGKLTRIYQPRTYLVPDRERTSPSPPGLFRWIGPVFRTSSAEFIQKSGLDAYFFLRYLRMLLKIFVPLALLLLPVLLPINRVDGKGKTYTNGHNGSQWNVSGLDQLAWGNIKPENTHRYWAHLVMAIIVVVWICAIFFDELRGYIRLRQAYMTSPQHRLRASATTVLVTAIPPEWLEVEALDNLFDVFPGGIRNIWINRNFDELNEKVKQRNKVALKLESAETSLIAQCKEAQLKQLKSERKSKGAKGKLSSEDREKMATDQRASQMAMDAGVSSGNPHQVQTLDEALHRNPDSHQRQTSNASRTRVFDPALAAAGAVGMGVGKLGKTVLGGLKKVEGGFDNTFTQNRGLVAAIDNELPSRQITPPGNEDLSLSNSADTEYPSSAPMPQIPEPKQSKGSMCRDHRTPPTRPFWRSRGSSYSKHTKNDPETDEHPLTAPDTPIDVDRLPSTQPCDEKGHESKNRKEGDKMEGEQYPISYNEAFDNEDYGEPLWKKYIRPKDRDTWRLPLFKWSKWPTIWLIGKKVDTIDYCRKELARLNLEIEIDQQHPERFPLMNSAFIQFNHQVAAHMACQSVAHHLPKQMAPRIVEISPDDVIWDNMSLKWWERYLRTIGIIIIVCAMVVGWAFPVAFTGLLSQLSYLEGAFSWLSWISKLPSWFISAIQGVLPALCLAILMALLPLLLRFLSRKQGVHTGMAVELTVQNYYFAFLFVQLFLVVTIASSFSTIIDNATDVTNWADLLADNIPKSSNYFFSYMILQAMSVSAGALVQIFGLISWFILAPILDKTARKKWARTTNLNQMQWGSFFPVYTTLASIGMIYCVIAPLILVFNVITFGLFWFVYRYNTLYVTKFRFDTGGLLFPRAINQLFTGVYFMEASLIAMFFLVQDQHGHTSAKGQGIVMIFVLALTVVYQVLLANAFGPLIRYIPVTLEDDAIRRDEEFKRAQHARLGLPLDEDEEEKGPVDHGIPQPQHEEFQQDRDIELRSLESNQEDRKPNASRDHLSTPKFGDKRPSWASRSPNRRSKFFGVNSSSSLPTTKSLREKMAHDAMHDAENQGLPAKTLGHSLFSGLHDELEDLTPDERDQLVQRAFQHEALRAKRPVIWIPRDDIGVSDDEVYRTQRFSKHIWISNEYQALDGKCRTIFSRSPPDFSEVDLIQL